ncbi:RNA polymerase sigma factor [Chondrinema litorale]|uniref:RNA polymerase sigma factor n=1 Tax=Chondrinema litorale TaxID=2994555 RepID=UPI002543AA52|nr:sigma-70 family RNA polymerase sigma factor [Chondrinema litorale]UZR99747.1 sigma-70 family RNA polymerase sigma factor [Chondrinema litorale]
MRHITTNSYDEVLTLSDNKSIHAISNFKDDKETWIQFKAGSEPALVHIYNCYYKSLYNYTSQFTKDRNLIKDTIQDLFIELMQKRDKLSETTSIKFYLFRSIKNNLVAKIRRNSKMNLQSNLLDGYDFSLSYSIEQIIINQQIDKENQLRINNALKVLTRKQREIIYYYFFEELKMEEIAVLMDFTNQKSAQNLLYKSIKLLKGKLLIVSTINLYIMLLKFF